MIFSNFKSCWLSLYLCVLVIGCSAKSSSETGGDTEPNGSENAGEKTLVAQDIVIDTDLDGVVDIIQHIEIEDNYPVVKNYDLNADGDFEDNEDWLITMTIDEHEHTTRYVRVHGDGSDYSSYTYENSYDDNGNIVQTVAYSEGESEPVATFDYTVTTDENLNVYEMKTGEGFSILSVFDANGKWIREEDTIEGESVTIYEISSDGMTPDSITSYQTDDIDSADFYTTEYYSMTRDEFGYPTAILNHIVDYEREGDDEFFVDDSQVSSVWQVTNTYSDGQVTTTIDADVDGVPQPNDCDDTVVDKTLGTPSCVGDACESLEFSCDDAAAGTGGSVNTGSDDNVGDACTTEICDGLDNDCDGLIDDDDSYVSDESDWYLDEDADGYGYWAARVTSCAQPVGYVDNDDDCNDGLYSADNSACEYIYYHDWDGDGYGDLDSQFSSTVAYDSDYYVTNGDDCDDDNDQIHPNHTDCTEFTIVAGISRGGDGIDNDCDQQIDEDTDCGPDFDVQVLPYEPIF